MFPSCKCFGNTKCLFPVPCDSFCCTSFVPLLISLIFDFYLSNLDSIVSDLSVAIVVSKGQLDFLKFFFANEDFNSYLDDIDFVFLLKNRVVFVVQESPLGFGDAICCAEEFVADDPYFVVMIGDFFYHKENDCDGKKRSSCCGDLIFAFKSLLTQPSQFLSVTTCGIDDLDNYGIVTKFETNEKFIQALDIEEKPGKNNKCGIQKVSSYMDGSEEFLTFFGIEIFSVEIFKYLKELKNKNILRQGEINLRIAQQEMIKKSKNHSLCFLMPKSSKNFDCGTAEKYRESIKTRLSIIKEKT